MVAVEGRKSIAPMDIIAVLTKVAQEQQTQLKTQEQTIGELRQMMATQQAQFEQRLTAQQLQFEQSFTVLQTRMMEVERQQQTPQWAMRTE